MVWVYALDYLLLGFVVTLFYAVANKREFKKMNRVEANVHFIVSWLIFPIVLIYELVNFLVNYFVLND